MCAGWDLHKVKLIRQWGRIVPMSFRSRVERLSTKKTIETGSLETLQ
jgi:hypothetical protein